MDELLDVKVPDNTGVFEGSLNRRTSEIKRDRVAKMTGGTKIIYRRKVEDFETAINALLMERDGLLDLNGTSTTSIISLGDFDAEKFTDADMKIGMQLRELRIRLEDAKERYEYLFGKY
jgi:hypothetical protein